MSQPVKLLIGILVFIGFIFYFYGVWQACAISLEEIKPGKTPRVMPEFLASVVTAIGAVLATNVGAVLGIAITQSASKYRLSKSWNPANFFSQTETMQTVACYVYIICLFGAAIVWGKENFRTDVVTIIPEMAKTLLGIIVGCLAISLNKTE